MSIEIRRKVTGHFAIKDSKEFYRRFLNNIVEDLSRIDNRYQSLKNSPETFPFTGIFKPNNAQKIFGEFLPVRSKQQRRLTTTRPRSMLFDVVDPHCRVGHDQLKELTAVNVHRYQVSG